MSEAYPFESDDDIQIRELDLESVDTFGEQRITVGELVGENESWRFGHVIVDEAQDLTPMQWRMVMRRVRGRSLTVVGDLAQQSTGSAGSWGEILPPELHAAERQDLTVNYRSPIEIHRLATQVLADFAPGVAPSQALRAIGFDPEFRQVASVGAAVALAVDEMLSAVGGQVAVLRRAETSASAGESIARERGDDRVRYLTPAESKGLEFDAVVLVEPGDIWAQRNGPAQLYIALTRATQRLVVLHANGLPEPLR